MASGLDADPLVGALIDFIKSDVLRGETTDIDAETPLFSTGLLDSMTVFDVLLKLEFLTNRRIPAARLRIKDLDTVALMFAAAERVGKPKA